MRPDLLQRLRQLAELDAVLEAGIANLQWGSGALHVCEHYGAFIDRNDTEAESFGTGNR